MVNKGFWKNNDFVFASNTFGCVKQRAVICSVASKAVISMLTTVRVKEGQKPSKTLMLFIMICWNRTKPSLGNGIERNWCVWAGHCAKKGPQYEQRHEKVILQHGNARPHVAKSVKTYLETLKWKFLPHPSYSPDIAPSDYYLFRSIAHGLAHQQFRSYEDIEKWLDSWIASKNEHFYRNGIRALPERWAKVVANDGKYFEWFICNHFCHCQFTIEVSLFMHSLTQVVF